MFSIFPGRHNHLFVVVLAIIKSILNDWQTLCLGKGNWLETWYALIWIVDLLAWLVFAKLSLTFLIAEMRSLYHFIIVIRTFQPVALVLIFKITNYRRCSWVITSSSMVNCSFWLAIMTVSNTSKIGLMLEGKVDLQCIIVCQCYDCDVYH